MAGRRHKKGHDGAHGEERWLLTYADMITLLMVFFIVLYAMSNTDSKKFHALAASMSQAFNTGVYSGSGALSIMDGQTSGVTVGGFGSTAGFDTSTGAMNSDYRVVSASLKDWAIKNGIDQSVTVEKVTEGIVMRFSSSLLFASGRTVLDSHSEQILAEVAKLLKPLPNQVRIEGHTDDTAPSGPLYTDNWHLSTDRSIAVLEALVRSGITASRLSAVGYAQYQPLVSNVDDVSRAKNRRVDVLILYAGTTDAASSSIAPSIIPGVPSIAPVAPTAAPSAAH